MTITVKRTGTIVGYENNGKVRVKLNDGTSLTNYDYIVDIPTAYSTQSGAFIGGYPELFTQVYMEQSQGGWKIGGYSLPDNVYYNRDSATSVSKNLMSDLKPGRILIQSSNAKNKITVDESYILSGNTINYIKLDDSQSVLSTSFDSSWDFNTAYRAVSGQVRRDLNYIINEYGSDRGTEYNSDLFVVGMDRTINTSTITTNGYYRNLPLAESRTIHYEFEEKSDSNSYQDDKRESEKYQPSKLSISDRSGIKSNTKNTAFDLNLYTPNKLIERIEGTGVDNLSNILDINRNVLPIGIGDFGFNDVEDSIEAFSNIRALHRKSIAYHFEINARKSLGNYDVYEVKPTSYRDNYARDRSTFFLDIDKEGQFKMNIPMSSEIGNIPLPTRYVNSSVLAWEEKKVKDPDSYLINESNNIDIFLENHSANTDGVELIDEFGFLAKDRFDDKPIKLNTVYHNILNAGYQYTKARSDSGPMFGFMDNFSLNNRINEIQYESIVSPKVIVSGDSANAGGRSGTINTDGFLSMSIGANTVDRQSLWLDTAGGIVSTIGRDRRGISYAATLDGDLVVQIGGPGLASRSDDRFSNENSGFKSGTMDIRVLDENGAQMSIVRIDKQGVSIYTFGRMEVMSQQNMIFKSNSNILFEAENITFYNETNPRTIKRNGVSEI